MGMMALCTQHNNQMLPLSSGLNLGKSAQPGKSASCRAAICPISAVELGFDADRAGAQPFPYLRLAVFSGR